LQYLLRLADQDETGSEEDLSGLFQQFRPQGAGVERVFAPLERGRDYMERLLPVYAATASSPLDDAYFVVRDHPEISRAAVLRLGETFAASLAELARQIANPELDAICRNATVTVCDFASEDLQSDEHSLVYDVIGDWFIDLADFDQPDTILEDAFYSIACDPWLSLYLQWPHFADRASGDPFASYFALWQSGLDFAFTGNRLCIGRRRTPPAES
jgi:hypothetical protein